MGIHDPPRTDVIMNFYVHLQKVKRKVSKNLIYFGKFSDFCVSEK